MKFKLALSDFYVERNVILEVGFGMGDNLNFMLENDPNHVL